MVAGDDITFEDGVLRPIRKLAENSNLGVMPECVGNMYEAGNVNGP